MNLLDHTFPPQVTGLYNEELANQLAATQGAIASLAILDRLLPNPDLLMHPIVAKEAESSSQLEGTQASVEDAYKIGVIEQTLEEKNEALEIRNYENAMYAGIELIKSRPIDKFTFREIHRVLLATGRGKDKHPGEFRKREVWIGGKGTLKGESRYVPPDALHVDSLMDKLLAFVQDYGTTNPIVACAVIHHRFEAIHPFEDGNGRTGRLLISLFLMRNGILKMPILYPSGYFEKNKSVYMDALSDVDNNENWYAWILFFLQGLEQQAKVSLDIGLKIDTLFKEYRNLIMDSKTGLSLMKVLEFSFKHYFITAPIVSRSTGIALTSCKRYLEMLEEKKALVDMGIHNKQRVYANVKLLDILRAI